MTLNSTTQQHARMQQPHAWLRAAKRGGEQPVRTRNLRAEDELDAHAIQAV